MNPKDDSRNQQRGSLSSIAFIDSHVEDFAPQLLVQFIEEQGSALMNKKVPLQQELETVAVFLDVSGFTKLTENLSSKGSLGAELLGFYLNRYFERLVKIISKYGGDVVKFAGDAMIVLWPPEYTEEGELDLSLMASKAGVCTVSLQEELHGAELAEGVAFSVKVGIGIGKSCILHLGGVFSRVEYIACGDVLMQAFHSEHLCNSGDIVASKEAWEYMNPNFQGVPLNDGYVKIVKAKKGVRSISIKRTYLSTNEGLAILNNYVPASIKPFIKSSQASWSAELRSISVLFVNLGFKPEEMVSISQPFLNTIQSVFQIVQSATYRWEGSINKFLLDDKGSTVLIAFGLPPVTHIDDPKRAIQLALDLVGKLHDEDPHRSRYIGVTTGTALCGPVGSTSRREYSVLGDMVNVSARLMQASKTETNRLKQNESFFGCILCDETTKIQAEREEEFLFDCVEGGLALKGKAKPIVVYQPGLVRSKTMWQEKFSSTFSKRAANVVKFNQRVDFDLLLAVDNFFGSKGQFPSTVVLLGEPGCGKSTLLDQFVGILVHEYGATAHMTLSGKVETTSDIAENKNHHLQNAVLIRAGSHPTKQPLQTSFAWSSILDTLQSICSKHGIAIQSQSDTRVFCGAKTSQTELATQISAIAIRLLESILDNVGSVIIVLDKCQFMTSIDWVITKMISDECCDQYDPEAERFSGIFMVVSNWPAEKSIHKPNFGDTDPNYLHLIHSIDHELICANGLKWDDTERIGLSLLQCSYMSTQLSGFLWKLSKGNIMLVEESLRSLKAQQLITKRKNLTGQLGAELVNSQTFDKMVPVQTETGEEPSYSSGNVRRLISGYIDRLSPNDQIFLKCASVISKASGNTGLYFDLGVVMSIYPIHEDFEGCISHTVTFKDIGGHIQPEIQVSDGSLTNFYNRIEKLKRFGLIERCPRPDNKWSDKRYTKIGSGEHCLYFAPVPSDDISADSNRDTTSATARELFRRKEDCFRFTNLHVRDVVYNRALFSHRKRLHTSAAQILQQVVTYLKDDIRCNKGTIDLKKFALLGCMNHNFYGNEFHAANESHFSLFGKKGIFKAKVTDGLSDNAGDASKTDGYSAHSLKDSAKKKLLGMPRRFSIRRPTFSEEIKPSNLENASFKKRHSGVQQMNKTLLDAMAQVEKMQEQTVLPRSQSFFQKEGFSKLQSGGSNRSSLIQSSDNQVENIEETSSSRNLLEEKGIQEESDLPFWVKYFPGCCRGNKVVDISPKKEFKPSKQIEGTSIQVSNSRASSALQSMKRFPTNALLHLDSKALLSDGSHKLNSKSYATPTGRSHFLQRYSMATGSIHHALKDVIEELDMWSFDVFRFEQFSKGMPLYMVSKLLFTKYGFLNSFHIDQMAFDIFATQVELGYPDNLYHNSLHAADVTQSVNVLLMTMHSDRLPTELGLADFTPVSTDGRRNSAVNSSVRDHLFTQIECMSLLLAAMVHDYKHPGVTGIFLEATKNPIALDYETPQLERYHFAEAKPLVEKLLEGSIHGASSAVLKLVQRFVLATSLTFHHPFVQNMTSELDTPEGFVRMIQSPEMHYLPLELVIKCADVSNCAKPLDLYKKWVVRISEEFLTQGHMEADLGLPVSKFMNRFDPAMQIGFINAIVRPIYTILLKMYPKTTFCNARVQENYQFWKNFNVEEVRKDDASQVRRNRSRGSMISSAPPEILESE